MGSMALNQLSENNKIFLQKEKKEKRWVGGEATHKGKHGGFEKVKENR